MKGVDFDLRPGEIPVIFRFTIKAAREMERAAGCNYQTLLASSRQVEAICLLTCYGLKHDDPKMTVEKATDLVDAYVDQGGNIVALYEALQKAMNKSGCYGPPLDEDAPARPLEPAAA
jgi:hypothetical protein